MVFESVLGGYCYMASYYNENDPKAAAWLRELIKEKLIADGEVDERSIKEVKPKDVEGFTQCHFFAGIGGWSLALRLAGWTDDRPVWTGSCPCQPFSVAGKGKAQKDPRHLWPWFRHLIFRCRPPIAFGEQVASADGRIWLSGIRANLETMGYATGPQICALRASARRTSDSDCSGWPTPAVQNSEGGPNPSGNTGEHFTLQTAANLAGWPTPQVHQGPNNSENRGKNWGGKRARKTPQNVPDMIPAGWATPSSPDWKDTPGMSTTGVNPDGTVRKRLDQLPRQASLAHGTISSSSPAEMANRGALNPDLSRWLMGYPDEWGCCGATAMQSSRKSQRNSSGQ